MRLVLLIFALFVSTLTSSSTSEPENDKSPAEGGFDEHLRQMIFMHTGLTVEEYLKSLRRSVYGPRTDSPEAARAKELGYLF